MERFEVKTDRKAYKVVDTHHNGRTVGEDLTRAEARAVAASMNATQAAVILASLARSERARELGQ